MQFIYKSKLNTRVRTNPTLRVVPRVTTSIKVINAIVLAAMNEGRIK
jgi:hypothetical protein